MTIFSDLTLDQVRKTARQVVDEFGENHVYTPPPGKDSLDCFYVHGNKPGCIVGVILNRCGVTLKELKGLEGFTAEMLSKWTSMSEDVAEYLQDLQTIQDEHGTWGDALTIAEERVS